MTVAEAPAGAGDRDLSSEQQDFVAAIRDFCAREITPERLAQLTDGFSDLHNDALAARMAELG